MALTLKDVKEAYSLKNNFRTIFYRTNDRWAFMDGWRFIGIAMVISGHCIFSLQFEYGMDWWRKTVENMPMYFHWMINGDNAIDAFFMISAFLMANMLMKQHQERGKIKVGIFYLSRYMRLTPAYFLAIGVYLSVQPDALETKTLWPNFIYLQNFIQDYDQIFMHFTWSLALEEQFYVLLPPFLIFIFYKSNQKIAWLAGLFLFSFLIRLYFVMNDEILRTTPFKEIVFNEKYFEHWFVSFYDNLYTRYGAFICGIFAAYIFRYKSSEIQEFMQTKSALWLTHFCLLIWFALLLVPVLHKDFLMTYEFNIFWQTCKRNIFTFSSTWLILCGLYPNHLAKRYLNFMSLKIFHPFGHLLYSMYLFHYIAVGFVMLNLKANIEYYQIDISEVFIPFILLAFILSFICTMILSMITFLLIELPIMNLRPK